MDDVCIILQGYSISKQQLLKLVTEYIDLGFKKIVISSYDKCVDEKIGEMYCDKVAIVLNDKIEGNKKVKDGASSNYNEQKPNNLEAVVDRNFPPKVHPKQLSTNFQILTTNRGLKLADIHFPTSKFYLKCRADVKLENLDVLVEDWIERLEENPCEKGDIFDNKILAYASARDWVVNDFWLFGTKKDIKSYYNIEYTNKKVKPEEWLCASYIRSKFKKIQWPEAEEKYWLFDPCTKMVWYKEILAKKK
jgi:hypothetical protein